MAGLLESLGGYRVIKGIGRHDVVGILENGPGGTVILRVDMDALPHLENTNLEYASTKTFKGRDEKEPLCYSTQKRQWSRTFLVLFQSAEELAVGVRAMIEDSLYDPSRFAVPKPDIVLGQHTHVFKAGMMTLAGGAILTVVNSFDVRIFGKSEHSRADLCVDSVVTASYIVVHLQSIVTKKDEPEEFDVVGFASIHRGTTANIIPDFVDLRISIPSYNTAIHERLVTAVKRVVYSEREISGFVAI
ncbi:hypothetical protein OCU04_005450 [Sclerotinia nivalis]|uniref:Uncharacterized protein n=1 Tax=Sclerotinia nivalis TaxID=352851 RepID=A0A9X0AQ31_9HELO|nr:hypothetical protein OCU04_005450 [Sclerotinia nivalis]